MSVQELWDPCIFLNYCYNRWFNTHFIYLRLHKSQQHLMELFSSMQTLDCMEGAQREGKTGWTLSTKMPLWGELSPHEHPSGENQIARMKENRGLDIPKLQVCVRRSVESNSLQPQEL